MPGSRRRKAFRRAALPHLGRLYRTARQMTDPAAAEDLVQETYLRAWKYFDTFERGSNCKAWLFRILRNVWIDRLQGAASEVPCDEDRLGALAAHDDVGEEIARNQFSDDVREALSALPDEYRIAVLLVDVEEFSYREIAEIMDCPIGTVMSRISRGRRMLRRLLRSQAHDYLAAEDSREEKDRS